MNSNGVLILIAEEAKSRQLMSLTETLSSFSRLSMVSYEQLGASFTKSLLFNEAFITVLFRRRWIAKNTPIESSAFIFLLYI